MADNETMVYSGNPDGENQIRRVLNTVYESLKVKGYNPISQLVGYIMSGDPTYITSNNNARNLIIKIERDEILEELFKEYLNEK